LQLSSWGPPPSTQHILIFAQGVPGLTRKYYGLTPDDVSLVGIYLWENRAAADAFYTDDWISRVSGRWQSQATRQDWETPMVVENAEHRLIAAE
jgi:hypothetical protein